MNGSLRVKFPEKLSRETFLLHLRAKLYVFSEMYSSQKKNSLERESFLFKDKSSQNFLKSLVYFLLDKISKLANDIIS